MEGMEDGRSGIKRMRFEDTLGLVREELEIAKILMEGWGFRGGEYPWLQSLYNASQGTFTVLVLRILGVLLASSR